MDIHISYMFMDKVSYHMKIDEIIAVYISSVHFIALIYLKTHDYEIIPAKNPNSKENKTFPVLRRIV